MTGIELLVGPIVSLIVQWIKTKYPSNQYVTLAVLAILSLLAAGVYTYFVAANYWPVVATVITTAAAFYTLIVARFTTP